MVFTDKNNCVMANLYSKIHRLKAQGWTWDKFLQEIEKHYPAGLEEKTLKAHFKQPHRKASNHVTQAIETVHNIYFPSPFPEDIEALVRIYNRLLKNTSHAPTDENINDLSLFISGELKQSRNQNLLRDVRLHWLKANIYFDQLPNLRQSGNKALLLETKNTAIKHYYLAIELINHHNATQNPPSVSEFVLYKLQQNILACHLNSVVPDKRLTDKAVLNHLKESDFFLQSKTVLEQEPFQWVVARNGLRFSSITKNKDDCQWFFNALIKSNKHFEDLNYSPVGYPAIINSMEFDWAIEHILNDKNRIQDE